MNHIMKTVFFPQRADLTQTKTTEKKHIETKQQQQLFQSWRKSEKDWPNPTFASATTTSAAPMEAALDCHKAASTDVHYRPTGREPTGASCLPAWPQHPPEQVSPVRTGKKVSRGLERGGELGVEWNSAVTGQEGRQIRPRRGAGLMAVVHAESQAPSGAWSTFPEQCASNGTAGPTWLHSSCWDLLWTRRQMSPFPKEISGSQHHLAGI